MSLTLISLIHQISIPPPQLLEKCVCGIDCACFGSECTSSCVSQHTRVQMTYEQHKDSNFYLACLLASDMPHVVLSYMQNNDNTTCADASSKAGSVHDSIACPSTRRLRNWLRCIRHLSGELIHASMQVCKQAACRIKKGKENYLHVCPCPLALLPRSHCSLETAASTQHDYQVPAGKP